MKNKRGQVIVISGPSGVGKGTIVKEIMCSDPNLAFSVSATTRAPRVGEIDGRHYHFISREQFNDMINSGDMLEYAEYGGTLYGTPQKSVEKELDDGRDVILEIDTQGAFQIIKKFPDAVSIFILPPSLDELKKRLCDRGTENENSVKIRFGAAERELSLADKFKYLVVNDKLEDAIFDVQCIIRASRLQKTNRSEILEKYNISNKDKRSE